ncbi:MAG: hypothetical protein HY017_26525 [Betaproteobacteria bacterium]|nr:hypothetical protein [Betaproteobacteria bacterium]
MSIVRSLADYIVATSSKEASPLIVAICGWADTGKSTLAAELSEAINSRNVGADWISTDAFLRNRADRNALGISGYNPSSIDATKLSHAVKQLAAQLEYVYFPYDNRTGCHVSTSKRISPQSIIVIEGIHAFHEAIWKLCHLRIYIDSDDQTLRSMRTRANVRKRGMNDAEASKRIDKEFDEYHAHVWPKRTLANISVNVSLTFEYTIQEDASRNAIEGNYIQKPSTNSILVTPNPSFNGTPDGAR